MNPIYQFPDSPKRLASLMSEYQFYPKKKLGQNFLIDSNITKIIVKALSLKDNDIIFEIGTGMGILTKELMSSAKNVFSIEKDLRLKPILNHLFPEDNEKVTIFYEDILDFDLAGFLKEKKSEGFQLNKITGNLPYAISLPLLKKIMEMHYLLKMAVVMVQKEVAERMMAKPGNKNYGLLSIISQYYASIEKVHLVKSDVFYPKPEVNSMIIRINFFDKPAVYVEDESLFFDLLHAVFQHRRKKLTNALNLYFGDKIDKNQLEKSLQELKIEKNERGETFNLQKFACLTSAIKKIMK